MNTSESAQPRDFEKDALIAAIRASLIYAAIVVRLPVSSKPLEAMKAFSDFVKGMRLPDTFSAWAIIGHDESNMLVCRILFKALGSATAASIEQTYNQERSPAVVYYDCFVDVQEKFVARIGEFCDDAICLAAAGSGGMIALWVPMTFVPGVALKGKGARRAMAHKNK